MKEDNNPNAFKNLINESLLIKMSEEIKFVYPHFDQKKFFQLKKDILPLELKRRVMVVREKLYELLPSSYKQSVQILLQSLKRNKLRGFDLWPYTDFIQTYGVLEDKNFDLSMKALYELTQRFTAEFALRPFLIKDPEKTLTVLKTWCKKSFPSEEEAKHIRRLISEGTRPRLPWGEKLHQFIKDPTQTLQLLDELKLDKELYVRKSVANHLNDISKDHPHLVIKTLKRWNKEKNLTSEDKKNLTWLTKHALRTLIKKGDPEALSLLGVKTNCPIKVKNLSLNKKNLRVGENLIFAFQVESNSQHDENLVVDYVIHHVRLHGKKMGDKKATSAKVFKLKNIIIPKNGSIHIEKKHSLREVTTRKYYSGEHLLEIQINGKIYLKETWHLKT